jgi:hypothetical protein
MFVYYLYIYLFYIYMLIYSLFKDVINSSDCVVNNRKIRRLVNNEFEGMWKEEFLVV